MPSGASPPPLVMTCSLMKTSASLALHRRWMLARRWPGTTIALGVRGDQAIGRSRARWRAQDPVMEKEA
ncbi:hypothetical protein GCM10022419_060950 [Nonomuraea rosea]|uniref:Uncharacterized protein n=1 Tax=Nonomuraea rosea TaxID=638574 RepID=A0ABP6XSR5_9ACTN